jgi:hypothetical protein
MGRGAVFRARKCSVVRVSISETWQRWGRCYLAPPRTPHVLLYLAGFCTVYCENYIFARYTKCY